MAEATAQPAGVDVGQVASLLNLTPRRVQQLAKEGVIPRPERGRYQIAGCVRGYIAFLQRALDTAHAKAMQPMNVDLTLQRSRKTAAEAELAEIDVARMRSEVVSVDQAEAVVVELLTNLRAQLIPFPRTAAPKLLGAKSLQELEARLEIETARIMGVLAEVSLVSEQQEAA